MFRAIKEWWRWVWRIDWELVETVDTNLDPFKLGTIKHPHFWEVWRDKRTGAMMRYPVILERTN